MIREAVAVRNEKSPISLDLGNGILASRSDKQGHIEQVSFGIESPLFPHSETETLAFYMLRYVDIGFVFRKPRTPTAGSSDHDKEDLSILFGTANSTDVKITYDLRTAKFGIDTGEMRVDPKYWYNNKNILSVADLTGGRMTVTLRSIVAPNLGDNVTNATIDKIRSRLMFVSMTLQFSRGRRVTVTTWPTPQYDERGLPFFDLMFPELEAREVEMKARP